MVYEKKVNEVTLKDIIEQKIDFTKKNDIFQGEEYRFVNKGELLAYGQMLADVEMLQVKSFINKYIDIVKEINRKFDNNLVENSVEIEELSGFNNAIINVIKLIDPIYEFKMD